jgi:hypothetical protein
MRSAIITCEVRHKVTEYSHIQEHPVIEPFISGVSKSFHSHICIGSHEHGPDQRNQHQLWSVENDGTATPRVSTAHSTRVGGAHFVQDTQPEDKDGADES